MRTSRFGAPIGVCLVVALPGVPADAQCGQWNAPFGNMGGFGIVSALCEWDPDGPGPQDALLIAGGSFNAANGVPVSNIAAWNRTTSTWSAIGAGLNGQVRALTVWDPDGDGVGTLIAGGDFTQSGATPTPYIAAWTGAVWTGIGSPQLNQAVHALTQWDDDGAGPNPADLYIGGRFTAAGATTLNYVARLVGGVWAPLDTGFNFTVQALTPWDPDGAGPTPERLIAGGGFDSAGVTPMKFVSQWNGASWAPVGTGMNGVVYALARWDPDGAGPLPADLIAGGSFAAADSVPALAIARRSGTGVGGWTAMSAGFNNGVNAIAIWDADGSGPALPTPAPGGFFTTNNPDSRRYIATWNDSGAGSWDALGAGANAVVRAVLAWDPDGAGSEPVSLVIGGEFTTADNAPAVGIALWTPCAPAPACVGDVNGDGFTNSADFNILAGNFGNAVAPNTSGDLTGDGLVNSADFNVLAGDFGCGP